MRILTIFTGGTIGSRYENGKIGLNQNRYQLIEAAKQQFELAEVEFVPKEPYFVLSENLTPEHWNQLIDLFYHLNPLEYDGVIVTHGTDTLGYTANLLGLLLGNYPIPVALVSSAYAIEDPRANGVKNFKAAVDLIRARLSGVLVPFYQHGRMEVHLGTRLMQSRHFVDDFLSVNGVPFGMMNMETGAFQWNEEEGNVTPRQLEEGQSLLLNLQKENRLIRLSKRVIYIEPYVGISYHHDQIDHAAAILQGTYHSGTFAVDEKSGQTFYQAAREGNVPIFLAPIAKAHAETPYASTFKAKKDGFIALPNQSKEVAYAKLTLLGQLYSGKLLCEKAAQTLFFEAF